jgi:beta-glucanase (GH16 family)
MIVLPLLKRNLDMRTWILFDIRRMAKIAATLMLSLSFFSSCKEANKNVSPTPEPGPKDIPAIAPAICDFQLDETGLTSAGWIKTFEDNFDTDLAKWNVWTGGAYNNELQHYQASNIELENGSLLIRAKKQNVTGNTLPNDPAQKNFQFTSGRLECKTNISANSSSPKVRIIARIKLPAGNGLWPAFWTYGDAWPTQGEIDIIEARGQETKKYQTNYFYGSSENNNLVKGGEGFIETSEDLTTCFHVYEMIWEESKLTSLLDGTVVEIKTSGGYIPKLFGTQERITLNVAVGGWFFSNLDPSTIEAGTMQVDWVKVFTSK